MARGQHKEMRGLSLGDFLQMCSVCDPAKHNWMKKRKNMAVWIRKMVLAQHNCHS